MSASGPNLSLTFHDWPRGSAQPSNMTFNGRPARIGPSGRLTFQDGEPSPLIGPNSGPRFVTNKFKKRTLDQDHDCVQFSKRRATSSNEPGCKEPFKGPLVVTLKVPGTRLQELMERMREKSRRQALIKEGAERMHWMYEGSVFHLFSLLPIDIRIQIWGILDPASETVVQAKPLVHRPMATCMMPRATPVVLQICHESRNEYLYRADDNANQITSRGHNLYRQAFQDINGKMVYFSFEADELHLFSFRVAEKVVRDNLRTIVIGHTSQILQNDFRTRFRNSGSMRRLPKNIVAIKTTIRHCVCYDQHLRNHGILESRYDFKDLRKFPSLRKIVVVIGHWFLKHPARLQEMKDKVNIAMGIAKSAFPNFNVPKIEFRDEPMEHIGG